jgi:CDP-paratose 2-epimerase
MLGARGDILITGGAGFIGTNVARSYLDQDQAVHIFDNLSRPGVAENVEN